MTYGSLFSGIGGIDLAFDRCGMVCRWQCERDKNAMRVLKHHWPDVPKGYDICELSKWRRWATRQQTITLSLTRSAAKATTPARMARGEGRR